MNCSPRRVKEYQGKRAPTCNGGHGCEACWDKWATVQTGGVPGPITRDEELRIKHGGTP